MSTVIAGREVCRRNISPSSTTPSQKQPKHTEHTHALTHTQTHRWRRPPHWTASTQTKSSTIPDLPQHEKSSLKQSFAFTISWLRRFRFLFHFKYHFLWLSCPWRYRFSLFASFLIFGTQAVLCKHSSGWEWVFDGSAYDSDNQMGLFSNEIWSICFVLKRVKGRIFIIWQGNSDWFVNACVVIWSAPSQPPPTPPDAKLIAHQQITNKLRSAFLSSLWRVSALELHEDVDDHDLIV